MSWFCDVTRDYSITVSLNYTKQINEISCLYLDISFKKSDKKQILTNLPIFIDLIVPIKTKAPQCILIAYVIYIISFISKCIHNYFHISLHQPYLTKMQCLSKSFYVSQVSSPHPHPISNTQKIYISPPFYFLFKGISLSLFLFV